jgi:hypothetical protein
MYEQFAAALSYARAGIPVLPLHTPTGAGCSCHGSPCDRPGKHPRWHPELIPAGLQNASTDPELIRRWWRRWPRANIGLRTGMTVDVCDVDGDQGLRALLDLLDDHGFDGPRVRTGSGGWHLYLAATGAGNRVRLLPGVDWRGAGGYVVAPPSLHASGRRYEWARSPDWSRTLDAAVPPCPPQLWALLFPPPPPPAAPIRHPDRYGAVALANEAHRVAAAAVGERNNTLYRAARRLGGLLATGGIHERDITETLADAAAQARLGRAEIDRTIRSGLKAGRRRPRRVA